VSEDDYLDEVRKKKGHGHKVGNHGRRSHGESTGALKRAILERTVSIATKYVDWESKHGPVKIIMKDGKKVE
jgi:hypothetical protein